MCLIPYGSSAAKNRIYDTIGIALLVLLVSLLLTSFKPVDLRTKALFEPSCRGAVNITINPNLCYAHIRVSSLLLGDYLAEDYTVEIFDPSGNSLGDTIPGIYAGHTLQAEVSHNLSNFSCSSSIAVFDESAPVLQIPEDKILACYEDTAPATTGQATAFDCTTVTVDYVDEVTETVCGNPKVNILRIWTARDAQGYTTVDTQHIDIIRAGSDDIRFPPDLDFTCAQYLDDSEIISPREHKAGIPTLVSNPRCGLIFTSKDQRVDLCGDPDNSFIILRKWTVLDACGNTIFTEDGAGNDNMQLIRVRDQTPPLIEPIANDLAANIRTADSGLGLCASTGFIPAPNIFDECNAVSIRIFSPIGELEYVNGVDGAEGGYIPAPGLTLGGPHLIQYEATDACGNVSNASISINVIDTDVPIMLCDQSVTVSLSLAGKGVLEPFMIDEGVRDNCCLEKMQIRWESDPILSFRDRIEMYCQSESRQAVLRAWDCYGNYNDCTATISTHDPLPARILTRPSEVIEVDCGSDRTIYADPQYLAPVFEDNCPQDIQYLVRDSLNECGTADLWREWMLQDHPDHPVLRVGQLVRFTDDEAPVLNIVPPAPFCDWDGDCLGTVNYALPVADNCNEILVISHKFSPDGGAFVEDSFGQITSAENGFLLTGDYPVGEHEIYITVADPCGNTSDGRYPLVVTDCTPPSIECLEAPEFFIGEDQQLVLSPEDFVASASDACSSFSLAFAASNAENIIYDCDSLGLREVVIWATDAKNNRSQCAVSLQIVSEGNGCQPLGRVEGNVLTESGTGIALVAVSLHGPDTLRTLTGADGRYLFEGVPLDTDYELVVHKGINAGNGVSGLDIIRISRHILGLDYLTNPLHILAADVNKSGNVSTIDILAARQVILGLATQFSNNPDTWRFVPANYVFENPGRPLQERVPETVNFKMTQTEMILDFTGIKYGDVNGSANPGK